MDLPFAPSLPLAPTRSGVSLVTCHCCSAIVQDYQLEGGLVAYRAEQSGHAGMKKIESPITATVLRAISGPCACHIPASMHVQPCIAERQPMSPITIAFSFLST